MTNFHCWFIPLFEKSIAAHIFLLKKNAMNDSKETAFF